VDGGFADPKLSVIPRETASDREREGPVIPGFFMSAVYTVPLHIRESHTRIATLLSGECPSKTVLVFLYIPLSLFMLL
jgi:hypothetical protein